MLFEQHFNYTLTFQYLAFLYNFRHFQVFVFGYRPDDGYMGGDMEILIMSSHVTESANIIA